MPSRQIWIWKFEEQIDIYVKVIPLHHSRVTCKNNTKQCKEIYCKHFFPLSIYQNPQSSELLMCKEVTQFNKGTTNELYAIPKL